MKDLLKLVFSIKRLRKLFIIFIFSIIIAEGLITQAFPLLDREINDLIEKAIKGGEVNLNEVIPFYILIFLGTVIIDIFNRISHTVADVIRENVWNETFKIGFLKLVNHDIEYLGKESSVNKLNQINRASSRASQIFTDAASQFLRNALAALGALIIMATISWQVSLAMILVTGIYFQFII
ncbi:MAG: ABC transporter transmembrane domain-containing protein [Candidatus Dojkabacteria bacterium]|nr:ABC transporter transmembrane domain-containing protein [Candidatus Dojkabacteria bacterium]MDQ7020806.1 ABC transporter transmembrane domain-containing protein [Candidatus Dojkabacteria bacterium]